MAATAKSFSAKENEDGKHICFETKLNGDDIQSKLKLLRYQKIKRKLENGHQIATSCEIHTKDTPFNN